MAKETFKREQEHVNVGTMGHVDHGKTTLCAAITALSAERGLGEKKTYAQIDNAPEEKERGITINSSVVEFSTKRRHCALVDCPGHKDYVKNTITGMVQTDYLILVVAISDGLMPQSNEHLLLARQINMSPDRLIVFLNKEDQLPPEEREEMIDLAHMDVAGKIDKLFGEGASKKVTFLIGSGLEALTALDKAEGARTESDKKAIAIIEKLHDTIDNFPPPPRPTDKPFLLSVDKVLSIKGRGTVVTGNIEQGKLEKGAAVDLITSKGVKKTKVTGIEMFKKELDYAQAGDNAGLLLQGVDKNEVNSGDVICEPNSISAVKCFKAEVYILTKEEGGRHTHFTKKYSPQFYMRTSNITGNLTSIKSGEGKDGKGKDQDLVMPGDNIELEVELISKTAINKGLKFAMREGGRTIGAGIVTEVL